MNYLLRRDRRRLAKDLINQQIIEQAIDLERQHEDDRRRHFQSIIHDVQDSERRRHGRSYSQSADNRDHHRRHGASNFYEEPSRYRSGSLSQYRHDHHHHRRNESRECSLVTLTYRGSVAGRHGDEIMIVQRERTVFKGCVRHGDQLTFKSKRYGDESKLKLEFYINDLLEDRMTACCEHALIDSDQTHPFHIERVIGSKPCQECQLKSGRSSPTDRNITPSPPPEIPKNKRSSTVTNNQQRDTSSITRQRSLTHIETDTQRTKPRVSSNTQNGTEERTTSLLTENQQSKPKNQSNEQKSDKKKSSTLAVPQTNVEKAPSEGFPADISELTDSQALTTNRSEDKQQQPEDESTRFLPILSSTDRESPPPTPPKRVYGPPQLSTMLSVNEALDSPFETPPETREGTVDNSISQRSESLNIQQKKDSHSDSDNDNSQNENNQSSGFAQFLRSMSSNVENNQNQQATPQMPSMSINSARDLAMADDATQLLLTRIGIMRQQQVERPEPTISCAPRQRGNVEYFILVYLNSTPPDNSTTQLLRGLVNFLKFFDDMDDCVAFINSISNEKVILILSNSFCNSILPRIDDLQQIFTIYVLRENDDEKQISLNKQSKIKGLYSNINEIPKQLSIDINVVTRDLIAYMNISPNSTSPDPIFVYSHLISEIILDGEETESAMKELVNFARQEYYENEEELSRIDEFENEYQKERAIWWFTRQCFLSKMLNKALRIPEADVLFKLRLFLQHLHNQIENESISDTSRNVYLGQTIYQNDLEDLQKSLRNNGLLVFSQFLFGSSDLSRAIRIAKELPTLSDDYIPVVLHFNISSTIKCANTSSLRYTVDDDNDVLLNMGIIGRLTKIEKDNINEKGIASIYLTVVKYESERLIQQMLETKRTEIKGAAPFVTLIKLMMRMSQQARAEQLVEMIFEDETLKSDTNLQGSLAASCHLLGASCHARGDFKRAVELFHLSLNTFLRFVPPDSVQLSSTYNNIGSMYFRQDDFLKAAEYHQKALDVQIRSHSPNLNAIASYSNNVGVVQLKQGKYSDAVKSFHRALKILQQINELNDPDVASTYDNLGDAFLLQDKYEDALTNYTKALEIQRLVEPRNPQSLASFNNSIGNVYNKLHRYGDALVHFKRALEYHQEYLPTTHPSFASLYNNIGSMYYRQEQYSDALPCYLKSLEIELMCLPENHPTIAVTHFNIATTYTGLGRFEEAIISAERSVEQLLKTLPDNHSEVIENRSYIETIKRKQMLKGLFDTNTTNL